MSDVVPQLDEKLRARESQESCAPDAPVSKTARDVLDVTLRKTLRRLRKLAASSHAGPEAIHRLRVAIRRSEAAMRTFRPLEPRGRLRRLRERLKRMRRLAGEIRDIDVFVEHLASGLVGRGTQGEAAAVQRRRGELVDQLCRRARRELRRGLKRDVHEFTRRVRWRDATAEPSLGSIAAALLSPTARRCLSAAGQDLRDVHQVV